MNTVMSLLEAPYLIEAPPEGPANCHKIVAHPQNRSAPVNVLAWGASNINFTESLHKYIVQTRYVLLEITNGSHDNLLYFWELGEETACVV